MNAAQFLAQIEILSHPARLRAVVAAGSDPQNVALWDELERGDAYSKRLALLSCQGSRDSARVARCLRDASRLCRGLAVRLAAVLCNAEQLVPVFSELNRVDQKQLVKRLAMQKRRDVIDAILDSEARAGRELEAWLGYASAEFAARQQARFERASNSDWARFARSQPRFALAQLLEQAQAATRSDGVLLERANTVLGQASPHAPDAALDLVRVLSHHHTLSELAVESLLWHRPQQLAELALEQGEAFRVSFTTVARKLAPDTLLAILARFPAQSHQVPRFLKQVSPSQRAALWARFGLSWRDRYGAIGPEILRHIPRAQRHAEARRHFELPALGANPNAYLPYAAFLSWEEALQKLKPFLGDPDPELRAVALRALGNTVRYERAQAGDWLTLVRSRGNEADPVRAAMLEATAALPPATWKENHLADLRTIQRQALDARDLSAATAYYIQNLVVSLLPHFPEWAGEQIGELIKERGNISFAAVPLADRINDAQMQQVGPRLLPVFEAWCAREHTPFIHAMESLGRRLRVWDKGAQLLVQFVLTTSNALAFSGAYVLRKYRLDLFRELVPQLLAQDASWGTQPIVYDFLHKERQDLLSPMLLGRERPRGRFWTGRTRFVLPFTTGFWRWTPTQQHTFSLTLGEVVGDSKRDTPGAINATLQLAALPDIEPSLLLGLASLTNTRAALREAALRALSHLDAGQGVPELVAALDDERGRIAIYGLRRAILEMPLSQAMPILRATPLQKVTVAKEVLRLLGDLKNSEALELIFEFDARDLHRDVRVALLRALWEHLENPRVWPILERAAASDDPAIARMAARTTALRLSDAARERLNTLLAGLLAHPEPRVRMQVLESGTVGALADPNNRLLEGLFRALESRLEGEYKLAASAIWRTYAGRETQVVVAAITRLLPHRRALDAVVTQFLEQFRSSSRLLRPTALAIEAALSLDPLVLPLRLLVALEAFEAGQFAALVNALADAGQLHAGAVLSVAEELEMQRWRWGSSLALEALETYMASSPHPEVRRLALSALVGGTQESEGWRPERVARLEAYRRDPAPLVASAAQWTFVPGEA